MLVSPLDILRELGKQTNGRVKAVTLYDGNVCTWTHLPGRPWESKVVSGEPFSKQLQYVARGHKMRMFGNNHFLLAEIKGSFAVQPISFNQTNASYPLLKTAGPITIGNEQFPSFTKSGTYEPRHITLFKMAAFLKLINELSLGKQESLHFMANSISVYLDRPSLSRVTSAIENLETVAESISAPAEELNLSTLPVQFHPLIPFIRKWAINDDSDREDFVESLPKGVLAAFVGEIEAYLPSIDSYLDSFGDQAPPEAACALGRLAEAALEAKRLLKEKN
jgi:hypothetical protein